jgi:hypothetical protein
MWKPSKADRRAYAKKMQHQQEVEKKVCPVCFRERMEFVRLVGGICPNAATHRSEYTPGEICSVCQKEQDPGIMVTLIDGMRSCLRCAYTNDIETAEPML